MVMIRRTAWLGMLLLASPVVALDQTTQVMAVRDGMDKAVLEGDGATLAQMAEQLESLDGDWAEYYRAYAAYRRSQVSGTKKKQVKAFLNRCIDTLTELVARRPDLAEAHALHSSCYGNSAQFYMLRAAARGSAANKSLQQALKLGSGNPRVLLQEAQSLTYRPALFGGDKEKAMERLKLAAEIFPDWQSPDPEAPVWGEEETWLFIGRLHAEAGRTAEARAALEKALSLAPDYEAAQLELAELG